MLGKQQETIKPGAHERENDERSDGDRGPTSGRVFRQQ